MVNQLVSVTNLKIVFNNGDHQKVIIDDIDFNLSRGEILGIVGESGSGKTQSAFSILGIENGDPGIVGGDIVLKIGNNKTSNGAILNDIVKEEMHGEDTYYKKNRRLWKNYVNNNIKQIRGKNIFLMFQDPKSYLNPYWTIGKHFKRILPAVGILGDVKSLTEEALSRFGLSGQDKKYPHQLSGGQIQRAMIALGYACKPDIIIADEITTGLDVVNQAAVVNNLKLLLSNNYSGKNPGVILISHDLGFISKLANRIFVMYAGQGFELGDANTILDLNIPFKHPYTRELIEIYHKVHKNGYIEGDPPTLDKTPSGCRFHTRCNVFKGKKDLNCDKASPLDFHELDNNDHQIRCRKFESC